MFFVGIEFSGSHRRLCTPSDTFWTFTVGVSEPVWVFHPREYPALLAITRHKFLYRFVQPCDSVGLRPTVPSPPNQTPNAVLIFNHALTPMICDVPVHMQCNAPLLVISCHMCNECYMDNIIHTTHRVSRIITSYAYDFHTLIYSCQYIMHTYININI